MLVEYEIEDGIGYTLNFMGTKDHNLSTVVSPRRFKNVQLINIWITLVKYYL